jgi:hypothetical protein
MVLLTRMDSLRVKDLLLFPLRKMIVRLVSQLRACSHDIGMTCPLVQVSLPSPTLTLHVVLGYSINFSPHSTPCTTLTWGRQNAQTVPLSVICFSLEAKVWGEGVAWNIRNQHHLSVGSCCILSHWGLAQDHC